MVSLPNVQAVEKVVPEGDGTVEFIKTWPTIQGEGPDAGTPAVFVRLAGCNLRCPACDTNYTTNEVGQRTKLAVGQLAEYVRRGAEANRIGLVVLSGGEPLRQDIGPLCYLLLDSGLRVQIETNGTVFRPNLPFSNPGFSIVCSPKTKSIAAKLVPHIVAYKYVLEYGRIDDDGLPLSVLGNEVRVHRPNFERVNLHQIMVQPMDPGVEFETFADAGSDEETKNEFAMDQAYERNVRACVEVCQTHGYRLSLQTHKILGLE